MAALQEARITKACLAVLQTSMYGAMGACSLLTILCVFAKVMYNFLPRANVLPCAAVIAGVASYAAKRYEHRLSKRIDSFIFEDYVHAEKD
jgi:hypothetical protein